HINCLPKTGALLHAKAFSAMYSDCSAETSSDGHRGVRTEVAELVRSDRRSYVRWGVCGLLFFATTINYIDRQVLSILKPTLQAEFGWRESDYAWIVVAFQLAYAAMMPIAGRLIDRLGTRVGYAIAVVVWSAASFSHAFARNAAQFILARFAL